jgi:hypothetical protein
VLWVDAICINQSHNDERSQQVRLMKDIYRQASSVLIYLGIAAEETCPDSGISISDIWLDHLFLMASEIRALKAANKDPTSSPLLQQLLIEAYEDALNGTDSALWDGFYDFSDRHWWNRIWVVQEAAFAQKAVFICGERTIDYLDFQECFNALRACLHTREGQNIWDSLGTCLQHLRTVGLSRRESDEDLWFGKGDGDESGSESSSETVSVEGDNLNEKGKVLTKDEEEKRLLRDVFWILDESRELQATDSRDKIFAILSLVDEFGSILGVVDYSKSTTEVFTSVVKNHISLSKSLHILSQVAGVAWDPDEENGRPSWVPDWSTPVLYDCVDMMDNIYSASVSSPAIYSILNNDKELRIKGLIFDSIKIFDLADDMEAYEYYCIPSSRTPGWKKSCAVENLISSYPTGEPVREALWRSISWNISSRRTNRTTRPYPAANKTAGMFDKWLSTLMKSDDQEEIQREIQEETESFGQHIHDETPLGVTGKGYFCAVPCVAKVGDVIAVLSGGGMPFVLRKREGGEGYRLVGHCYVHGVMEGQVWPKDEGELEWISIY